ncbi:UNVERIFIED_CONTAM: hypothetical protein RMT77_004516 [Armadillidium vulgare]
MKALLGKISLNALRGFYFSTNQKMPVYYLHQNLARKAMFHISSYINAKGLPIKMPSLSPTMMEGTIVKWLKKEGETIQPGDVLCDIQTDKAVVSFETDDEGILAKILVSEDKKDVKIGTVIALMVEEGEDWKKVEYEEEESSAFEDPSKISVAHPEKTSGDSKIHLKDENYGPSVRLLLQKYGLVVDDVPIERHRGYLLKGDLLKYIKEKRLQPKPVQEHAPVAKIESKAPVSSKQKLPQQSEYVDLELSSMRKTIAKRLFQSKHSIAHTYTTLDCSLNNVLKVRKQLKGDGIKVSVNDILIKSVALCLRKCPEINCVWEGNQLVHKEGADISIAVATDFGLITPIVKRADKLGLEEISKTVQDLATRARHNKLRLDEFQGGTFTISNLGMFGIREFKAIINPPQCAILAVGGGSLQLDENGKPETRLQATLSFDQAAISDDTAAFFMKVLAQVLENPNFLLLDAFNDGRKSVESFI